MAFDFNRKKPFSYSFTLAVITKTLLLMTAAVNWSAHTALSTWITAQWPTQLTTTYLCLLDSWTRQERHCFIGAPVQGVMKTLGCRDQHSCPRAALLILHTILWHEMAFIVYIHWTFAGCHILMFLASEKIYIFEHCKYWWCNIVIFDVPVISPDISNYTLIESVYR